MKVSLESQGSLTAADTAVVPAASPQTSPKPRARSGLRLVTGFEPGSSATSAVALTPRSGTPHVEADDPLRGGEETSAAERIEALLAKYGEPDGKVRRSYERVLTVLCDIEAALTAAPDLKSVVDHALANDLRRRVFLLEDQMRLYKDLIGKEDGAELFKMASELENLLGDTLLYQGLVKQAKAVGASEEVQAYLKGKLDGTREQLERNVEAYWLPKNGPSGKVWGLRHFISVLNEVDWMSYKDDRRYLADQMAQTTEEVMGHRYDMTETGGKNGVHALRRALRRNHLDKEAAGGLVQLDEDENPIPAFKHYLSEPLASSKYVTLPSDELEKKPIYLSRSLYLANLDWMLKLGAIKDKGEPVERFAEAMMITGEAATAEEAHQKAAALLGPDYADEKVFGEAEKIYEEILRSGLFRAQIAELRSI